MAAVSAPPVSVFCFANMKRKVENLSHRIFSFFIYYLLRKKKNRDHTKVVFLSFCYVLIPLTLKLRYLPFIHFNNCLLKKIANNVTVISFSNSENWNRKKWKASIYNRLYFPVSPFYILTHWGRSKTDTISQTTFWSAFFNENVWILLRISLKFVSNVRINIIPALDQMMVWCRPRDKPLSEPMMVSLLTHICVNRPQWVNE